MALTTDFAELAPTARPVELGQDYSRYRIVPARHPGRIAGTAIAALIIVAVLYSTFTNPRWGWDVFAQWFFAEPVLVGLGRTLLLTVLAAISGSILGTALALARVSKSPLLSGLSWGYIWLLRSIPVIVLLLILNNLGYLYETITIGIPFTNTVFVNYPTVQLLRT
jgi:polar amino acid transport system permease protein